MLARLLITILSSFFFITLSTGQNLISAQFLESYTEAQIEALYGVDADNGVSLYKLLYITTHPPNNEEDTASGLLVLPEGYTTTHGIVAYQHGTSLDREDVPSRLVGEAGIPVAYGASGFISVAADYVGLGDSDEIQHPYVHAETEATAGFDMLIASVEYIESQLSDTWLGELFVSGYSQGGHGSMALHQYIQENFSIIWPVTKAAHMSGPYSISGVMKDKILSNDVYLFTGYIPNVILGYQQVYGNLYTSLSEIFKPTYVPHIEDFQNEEIDLYTLSVNLGAILQVTTGAVVPKRMFQDAIITEITNNPDHPINVALRDNDVYKWVPDCPTRLYYCTADDQVPYQNSIVAETEMTDLGATDVRAIDINSDFDHGQCVAPAVAESIAFFKGTSSSVDEINGKSKSFLIALSPNPATGIMTLSMNETDGKKGHPQTVQVYNMKGQLLHSADWKNEQSIQINVADWQPGTYILVGENEGTTYYSKFVRP